MNVLSQALPEGREPVLRVPATPSQTNAGGDIFGGWIMAQIDIAGSIPAVLHAKGAVVTASVKGMNFLKPVKVGDIVSLYAELTRPGRSSMTVEVEVYVQRNARSPETIKVSEATLVYVAIDEQGRPRAIDK